MPFYFSNLILQFAMKKKRYLMIVCLLSSPSFFINVEASDGGSSSVGIEF